jgi:hypothetical protein
VDEWLKFAASVVVMVGIIGTLAWRRWRSKRYQEPEK